MSAVDNTKEDPKEDPIHIHSYEQVYGDMGRRTEWIGRESYWKDKVYHERCRYRFAYKEGSGAPPNSTAPHGSVQCGMIAWKDGLCHYHYKLLKDTQKDVEQAAKWLREAKKDLKRAETLYNEALKKHQAAEAELKK